MSKKRLLVVLGSTATGKTDLALSLAKRFGGELIACDSRQVYQGLDIGTGKLPSAVILSASEGSQLDSSSVNRRTQNDIRRNNGFWAINGIKIWMYDVVSPKRQYSVADYAKDAGRVMREIRDRGVLPIVVGGTGLYLKVLLEGLPSLAIPVNKKLRGELIKLTVSQLQQRLQAASPTRWRQMNQSDRANKRRLIRAIEVVGLDSSLITQNDTDKNQDNILKIGLTAPRQVLYDKIDVRVLTRLNQGMIEEAIKLHQNGISFKRMKELGLEYGLLAEYLQGKINRLQLVDQLKTKIHQYAKRQLTWFKKEPDINWFDISQPNWQRQVEKRVSDWYNVTHEP